MRGGCHGGTRMDKQPEKKTYRIGDYARYMGVTPDFLKHYEQFDLITPRIAQNGYRYYPFHESSRLLDCLVLRGYGVPLKEMSGMLREDDADAFCQKLDERADTLRRQIAISQAVVQEHERLSRWMARMKGREEDWHVLELPALLFLPHTNLYTFLDDPRIYELLSDWTPYMPMVKSCLRITPAEGGGTPAYCWGLIVRQDFAQTYDLPTNDALEVLPARKAFVLDYCGWQVSPGESPLQRHYERFLSRMEALRLRPAGSVYLTVHFHTHDADGTRRDHGFMAAAVE